MLLDNSKTKIYIPHQDEPIFDFGEWKVSGKYLEEILGNTSEVTVIVKYTMMSKVSDTIAKPHKVKISSDVQREIICPKLGRTAEGFFDQDIVDERTLQYQLTTSDLFGQKLDLYIGDPKFPSSDGKHHTLKFKMPRKTRKVYIQSDPPIAPSTGSTAFTLHCELETKNNVITDGDWTFEIGSNGNPNIVRIPFEEGIRHPFFDEDNLREKRWKKYVLPTIQAFAGPVAAAAITGGASIAAAAIGTPTRVSFT